MPTPRDDPSLQRIWEQRVGALLRIGFSLTAACIDVARDYSVRPATVREYVDADYYQRCLDRSRASNRRIRNRKKRDRLFHEVYPLKGDEEELDAYTLHQRMSHRLNRRPDVFARAVFESMGSPQSLQDLTGHIRDVACGVGFQESTVQRVMRGYAQSQRGPPYLTEDPVGTWHYSLEKPFERQ